MHDILITRDLNYSNAELSSGHLDFIFIFKYFMPSRSQSGNGRCAFAHIGK